MEFIKSILSEYVLYVFYYSLCVSFILIILFYNKRKRNKKYLIWKEKINLGVYSVEWENNRDIIIKQLFEEKESLSDELNVIKRRYNTLSLQVFIVVVINTVLSKFKIHEKTSNIN